MRQGDPKGMTDRGSGRTYRQLEKLAAGDFFLVHSMDAARLCNRMLHEHFDNRGVLVKVVSSGMEPDFLRGIRTGIWIEVDHHLWELWDYAQDDQTRRQSIVFHEIILEHNSRSGRADE